MNTNAEPLFEEKGVIEEDEGLFPAHDEQAGMAVISIQPEADATIIDLMEQARRLLEYAHKAEVKSSTDALAVTDDLTIIGQLKKALTNKQLSYTAPIDKHLRSVRAAFKSFFEPVDQADKILRQKMTEYSAEQRRRYMEAQAINKAKEDLARREAEFSGTGEFTVDTTPVQEPFVSKTFNSGVGSSSFVAVRTWELEDFEKVPNQYKELASGKITKTIKAGGSIPGIRIIEKETLRVNARRT
jgi:hypothetical protein